MGQHEEMSHKLRSQKMLKWLFIFVSLFLICTACLTIYIVVAVRNEDAKGRIFVNGESLGYPVEKMGRATVDILIKKENKGRAYLNSASQELLTNLHVMKIVCGGTKREPIPKTGCSEIGATLVQNNSERTKIYVLLTLRKCSEWMDACVLDVKPEKPIAIDQEPILHPKSGISLVAIPVVEDRGSSKTSLMTGTTLGDESVFLRANIPARPGYSGGPVFSNNGEFVGIFKTGSWDVGLNLTPIMKSFGLRPQGLMRRNTVLNSGDSLQRALLCHVSIDICPQQELSVFTEFVKDRLYQKSGSTLFNIEHVEAMQKFSKTFEKQVFSQNGTAELKDMLQLSIKGIDDSDELAKHSWSKNPELVRQLAILLTARASLQRNQDDLKRSLDLIEPLVGEKDFIRKLRNLSASAIWSMVVERKIVEDQVDTPGAEEN